MISWIFSKILMRNWSNFAAKMIKIYPFLPQPPHSCDKQTKLAVTKLDCRLCFSFVLVIMNMKISKNNQVYELWMYKGGKRTTNPKCFQTFFLDSNEWAWKCTSERTNARTSECVNAHTSKHANTCTSEHAIAWAYHPCRASLRSYPPINCPCPPLCNSTTAHL